MEIRSKDIPESPRATQKATRTPKSAPRAPQKCPTVPQERPTAPKRATRAPRGAQEGIKPDLAGERKAHVAALPKPLAFFRFLPAFHSFPKIDSLPSHTFASLSPAVFSFLSASSSHKTPQENQAKCLKAPDSQNPPQEPLNPRRNKGTDRVDLYLRLSLIN